VPIASTTRRSFRKEIIRPSEKYQWLLAIPDTTTADVARYFHVALLGHYYRHRAFKGVPFVGYFARSFHFATRVFADHGPCYRITNYLLIGNLALLHGLRTLRNEVLFRQALNLSIFHLWHVLRHSRHLHLCRDFPLAFLHVKP